MSNNFEEKSENSAVRRGLGGGQNGCHGIFWMASAETPLHKAHPPPPFFGIENHYSDLQENEATFGRHFFIEDQEHHGLLYVMLKV
jgi:hypothetical protein